MTNVLIDSHIALLPHIEPKTHREAVSDSRGTVVHDHVRYGCEDCLKMGPKEWWLHLRKCLSCGHIGCCDSSPHKHARKHACSMTHEMHPIVRSYEPNETWAFCFVDEAQVNVSQREVST